MADTPIDRESVERWECSACPRTMDPEMVADPLGDWVRYEDFRAALDAAEAEKQLAVAAALRKAASVAQNACLVPPDGGSPTEDEENVCRAAANYILSLIPDAGAALDRALAKAVRPYRIALADAIRRPMGVVPASAEGLVTTAELDAAEDRRVQDARDKAAAIRAQKENPDG